MSEQRPQEKQNAPVVIKTGSLAGCEFKLEGTLKEVFGKDSLGALPRVPSVMMAIILGGYSNADAPFYYGKIGSFGHVVSHGDLYGKTECRGRKT